MKLFINFSDNSKIILPDPTKSKVANFLRGRKDRHEVFVGNARVHYKGEYENKFDFSSKDDLENKLWPCIERSMANEF